MSQAPEGSPPPLGGKVALVTGAGRGLGRAHALALARAGAAVVVNDVGVDVDGGGGDGAIAGEVVDEIVAAGGRAEADTTDVASFAGGAAIVARAVDAFGRLDIAVNNAGISARVPLDRLDQDALERFLAVHLVGTVGVTRAAVEVMRSQGRGGRVVNTTSGAGMDDPAEGLTGYASAKAAVTAFTRVAALEAARHGITVNAVAPLAYTRMSAHYFGEQEAERLDPGHVARVVVLLASEAAGDITGRIVRVEADHVSEWHWTRTKGVRLPRAPVDADPAEAVASLRAALRRESA